MTFIDSELPSLLGEPLDGLLFTCVGVPKYASAAGRPPGSPTAMLGHAAWRIGSKKTQPEVARRPHHPIGGDGGTGAVAAGAMTAGFVRATHSVPSPNTVPTSQASPPRKGMRPIDRNPPHPTRKARYREESSLTTRRPRASAPTT